MEELLYDGESVRESIDLDPARVVVTSHRVLAFTPDRDGPNFRQVDRPNVEGVSPGADGDRTHLVRGIRWMAIGAILLVTGAAVDLDALIGRVDMGDAGGAQRIGAGGVLGLVRTTLDLLGRLDEGLMLAGAVAALAGLAAVGLYLRTRDATLVVAVAGDDDLHLPRPADAEVRDRLEAAVVPTGSGPPAEDPLREA